jgi:DNA topoisomerase-1
MELLREPKRGRRGREPLREIGTHPDDGEPINLFDGRYGPYVKHGKINASLPRGASPADVTLEQAVELIAERAEKVASGKTGKGGRRGGGRRK